MEPEQRVPWVGCPAAPVSRVGPARLAAGLRACVPGVSRRRRLQRRSAPAAALQFQIGRPACPAGRLRVSAAPPRADEVLGSGDYTTPTRTSGPCLALALPLALALVRAPRPTPAGSLARGLARWLTD